MGSEEIKKEIDRLWSRVNPGPERGGPLSEVPPPPPDNYSFSDIPSITREVSMEAISLLKRQHRSELVRLQQLVELKDRTIRELGDRLATVEGELAGSRRKSTRNNERARICQRCCAAPRKTLQRIGGYTRL